MINDTMIKQRTAGKRKRIPLNRKLQQTFPIQKEQETMTGEAVQNQRDDIAPEKIREALINVRFE